MLFETSFYDLYKNIEFGFPNTQYRQHATHPISIKSINYLPFIGVKTLFIKAIAENNSKQYSPMVLFKRVNFSINESKNSSIIDSNGKKYYFEQLSLKDTNLLVRCNCGDFKYRFSYYNHKDKSLYGKVVPKYESLGLRGPINPKEVSGFCKHCIKLFEVLENLHLIK